MANTRKDYLAGGLEVALNRKKPDREYERCLDGEGEAHLIALTCSDPPRRTSPLDTASFARAVCEVGVCRPSLARNRSHHVKKNELKPWQKEQWCIPPKSSAEFVCRMEDVLNTYVQPANPQRPLVCVYG